MVGFLDKGVPNLLCSALIGIEQLEYFVLAGQAYFKINVFVETGTGGTIAESFMTFIELYEVVLFQGTCVALYTKLKLSSDKLLCN